MQKRLSLFKHRWEEDTGGKRRQEKDRSQKTRLHTSSGALLYSVSISKPSLNCAVKSQILLQGFFCPGKLSWTFSLPNCISSTLSVAMSFAHHLPSASGAASSFSSAPGISLWKSYPTNSHRLLCTHCNISPSHHQ